MRLLIATLLLAAAAPLAAPAVAQEQTVTWYDVEIIVFRHLDARTSETWPPDAGVPDVSELVPLFPPDTDEAADGDGSDVMTAGLTDGSAQLHPGMPVPYVPLEESARQLNGVYGSLRRSSRYEPLLHVAWTQPPLDRAQAPQLRLTLPGALTPPRAEDEGDIANEQPLLGRMNDDASSLSAQENENAPAFLDEEESQAPTLARPLDGRIQLSVSRYLHLDLDLIYLPEDINSELLGNVPVATREWTEEEQQERDQRRRQILDALARGDLTLEEAEILALEPEQEVFEGFRLNQYRRLRSRELHYFDHPVYGAIVTVTPRQVSARMLDAGDTGNTSQ